MHSALFVVTIPAHDAGEIWEDLARSADRKLAPYTEAVVRFAENVWLLRLQKSMAPLGLLIADAEHRKITYGVLPFEREPEWLPGGFDPGTTPDRNA